MKFATKPSRNADAATNTTPTIAVSTAVAPNIAVGSPSGTASPSCAAVRIASVVVVLTDSGRDVPSSA